MPNTIKLKQLDRTDLTAFVNELIDGTGVVYTANRALVTDSLGDVTVSSVTSTELGYLSGVTSAIQTQLNAKQATITGGATSITSSDLTGSRALTSDASGKVAVSSVTATELGYVSGVTSAIQTQLNAKVGTSLTSAYIFVGNVSNIATGVVVSGDISISNAGVVAISNGVIVNNDINASAAIAVTKLAAVTTSRALVSDVSGFISASSVTSTELGYVSGVTSAIQTQINAKFTLPALTSGSILFSNGTTISQNNANLFWSIANTTLGIGTASPLTKLHVAGSILIDNNNGLIFGTNGASLTSYQKISGATNQENLTYATYSDHIFTTDTNSSGVGTARLTIKGASGNVGIGTTSPGAQLQVTCGAAGTIGQIIKGAASQTADLLQFQNSSGTVLFRIEADGKVNMGTHSAIGAETITGYIAIEDSGGTSRKLAVVS